MKIRINRIKEILQDPSELQADMAVLTAFIDCRHSKSNSQITPTFSTSRLRRR